MEREDITFVYEFDPKRGTRRVYSDLVKALQTPGAVIYFDEINTLPAGMVKLFNPLFDYRRYLTLPTGEVIKAHKEVILVGGMNPQNYLGVSELPQDIKSRADILFIDYPPFEEEGGLYSADEALILRDQVPELSLLSSEDFLYLWHHVVNGIKVKNIEGIERLEEHIWKLFELIKNSQRYKEGLQSLSNSTVGGTSGLCLFHKGYHKVRQKVKQVFRCEGTCDGYYTSKSKFPIREGNT